MALCKLDFETDQCSQNNIIYHSCTQPSQYGNLPKFVIGLWYTWTRLLVVLCKVDFVMYKCDQK